METPVESHFVYFFADHRNFGGNMVTQRFNHSENVICTVKSLSSRFVPIKNEAIVRPVGRILSDFLWQVIYHDRISHFFFIPDGFSSETRT